MSPRKKTGPVKDELKTPIKRRASAIVPAGTTGRAMTNPSRRLTRAVVTPSTEINVPLLEDTKEELPLQSTSQTSGARRRLFSPRRTQDGGAKVIEDADESIQDEEVSEPKAKRRLFGPSIPVPDNVKHVYSIVRKLTGSLGGNGYSGPIYGELTCGHMQKMVNLMIETTGLSSNSRFIDVGSGIGKPNLHVAQYPNVAFSCGVELEHVRWSLGLTCLKAILDAAALQRARTTGDLEPAQTIHGNCMFLHRDIMEATTFDPFTHVYMFSIGFPPNLWRTMSTMWNKSQSGYLICYHSPRDIVGKYHFDVELVTQMATSMHGSNEGHMGYIYKRKGLSSAYKQSDGSARCDPIFRDAWDLVQKGFGPLHESVSKVFDAEMGSERLKRSSKRQLTRGR